VLAARHTLAQDVELGDVIAQPRAPRPHLLEAGLGRAITLGRGRVAGLQCLEVGGRLARAPSGRLDLVELALGVLVGQRRTGRFRLGG